MAMFNYPAEMDIKRKKQNNPKIPLAMYSDWLDL